jgi:hypothetical protein
MVAIYINLFQKDCTARFKKNHTILHVLEDQKALLPTVR